MTIQLFIRPSSIGGFFDCNARWAAIHLDKMKSMTGSKAHLGTSIHKATEKADVARFENKEITKEVIELVEHTAVEMFNNPTEDVVWEDKDKQDGEAIARSLSKKYAKEVAPSLVVAASELSVSYDDAIEFTDLNVTIGGTVDLVLQNKQGLFVADKKTGKTAVDSSGSVNAAKYRLQIGAYEILADHFLRKNGFDGITTDSLIIGMTTAKTEASQRIGFGYTRGSQEHVVKALKFIRSAVDNAENAKRDDELFSDHFAENPNSFMCSEKYCPRFKQCSFFKN